MQLPELEIDLVPVKPVLLAHPHPGMKREQEMGQELREPAFDSRAKALLLGAGEEPTRPLPSVFRRMRDAEFFSIFSLSAPTRKISEKVACQRVAGGDGRVALLGLLRQPLYDLALADRFGRTRAEHGPELANPKTQFVGLFLTVFGRAVLQRVLAQFAEGDGFRAEVVSQLHAFELFSLALQKQLLGYAVAPGFFAVLAPFRVRPANPPNATSLEPSRRARAWT